MAKRLTTEQFIKNATLVHGNRYIYNKVDYVNCDFNVIITCRIHGDFHQTPYSHVNSKSGCVLCGNIRNSRTQRNNKRMSKFKNIVQPDDYKIIPLTKGKFAKVDNEDFERVSRINWSTTINGYCVNDKMGLMHRFIMNTPKNMDTDHKNMDKLDNRKCNLRICTRGQNETNKGKQNKETTSKYKGVSWSKNYRKWICQVVKNKEVVYFNTFDSEICAAKMYDLMSKKHHKEFSRSNKEIINENLR